MIGIATVEPLLKNRGAIPMEWVLLAAWATLGMAVWISTRSMRRLAKNDVPIERISQ
jgi:hypothetical protein